MLEFDVKILLQMSLQDLKKYLEPQGWYQSGDEDYSWPYEVGGYTSCEKLTGELRRTIFYNHEHYAPEYMHTIEVVYWQLEHQTKLIEVSGRKYFENIFGINPFDPKEKLGGIDLGYSYVYKMADVQVNSLEQEVEPTRKNGYKTRLEVHYVVGVEFYDEMKLGHLYIEF